MSTGMSRTTYFVEPRRGIICVAVVDMRHNPGIGRAVEQSDPSLEITDCRRPGTGTPDSR